MIKTFNILPNYQKFPKKDLSGKICLSPFVSATVLSKGLVALCACSGWHPSTVGNIFDQPLLEILNNNLSQEIRQTVIDGTYDFCNADKCGIIVSNQLNDPADLDEATRKKIQTRVGLPREIIMSGDMTCNLSCPSCRTQVYKPNELEIDNQIELGKAISKNCFSEPTENIILLTLSTTGELFASPMLLAFLESIPVDDFPNLSLHIQTNALLAKSRWHRLGAFQNRISRITVTFDSTEKETYEEIRRGGCWEDLINNLEFLQSKKQQQNFEYNSRMVVQLKNFHQMQDFYTMSKQYSFDRVEYGRLQDWSTWSPEEFKRHDVFDIEHEKYRQARSSFLEVQGLPDTMFFGGFGIDNPTTFRI